jgi:hypothetical protein
MAFGGEKMHLLPYPRSDGHRLKLTRVVPCSLAFAARPSLGFRIVGYLYASLLLPNGRPSAIAFAVPIPIAWLDAGGHALLLE